MRSPFLYALKVWTAGFILSPCILILHALLIDPKWPDVQGSDLKAALEIMLLFMIYGCILSLPSLVLLWYCSKKLVATKWNRIKIKALLSVIGIILTLLPFYWGGPFGMSLEKGMISISICYDLVIIAAIWYFKLPIQPTAKEELPPSELS